MLFVFDIDDTLYLERDYVRSGFEAVARWAREHLGLDALFLSMWDSFERGERGAIFDDALRLRGIEPEPEVIAQMVAIYRTHPPRIELCADALECLTRLQGRSSLAALTDGPQRSQAAKVRALDLHRWLERIVLTDALEPGSSKPNPSGFRMIQEELGVDPGSCVYVADNPVKDFAGPRALGWRTIRIRRPGGLYGHLESGDDVDDEVTTLEASPVGVA